MMCGQIWWILDRSSVLRGQFLSVRGWWIEYPRTSSTSGSWVLGGLKLSDIIGCCGVPVLVCFCCYLGIDRDLCFHGWCSQTCGKVWSGCGQVWSGHVKGHSVRTVFVARVCIILPLLRYNPVLNWYCCVISNSLNYLFFAHKKCADSVKVCG